MSPRIVTANRREYLRLGGRLFPVCTDRRGRRQVHLGKGHPLAYRNGKRWVARVILACKLGKMPPAQIHAHHRDGDKGHDARGNVVAKDRHQHLSETARAAARDSLGRFARRASLRY